MTRSITPAESASLQADVAREAEDFQVRDYTALIPSRETARWNYPGERGEPVTITYSFLTAAPDYYAADALERTTFVAFTAEQQRSARAILAQVEEITNITFARADGAGTITFGNTETIWGGYAWLPDAGELGGDIWINKAFKDWSAEPGQWMFAVIKHELGHALGLEHPHDGNVPFLAPEVDHHGYSVMSYRTAPGYLGTAGYVEPMTFMPFDIQALQDLYGVNRSTRTGDDTYGFNSTLAGRPEYSWTPATEPVCTIWDAGGVDTLDASGFALPSHLDLGEGAFSDVNGLLANVCIAYGTVLENAVGGAGSDSIHGNAVANLLRGNAGHDLMLGGGGNDDMRGERDDDQLLGEAGDDRLDGGSGGDQLAGGDGDDALAGKDGDDRLDGEAGRDRLGGGAGTDRLAGGDGDDRLDGGDGDDKLSGGADSDSLAGAEGADQLYGEDGNDVVTGGRGADRIEGQDGKDLLDGGEGDDRLFGGDGRDYLHGGDGADKLHGGADNDWLYGGRGDDRFYVSAGTDKLFGDGGTDVAVFGGEKADFTITVFDDYVRVIDRNQTDEGFNTAYLIDVETARFADTVVPLAVIGLPGAATADDLLI